MIVLFDINELLFKEFNDFFWLQIILNRLEFLELVSVDQLPSDVFFFLVYLLFEFAEYFVIFFVFSSLK